MGHPPQNPAKRLVNISDKHPANDICVNCRFHGQFNDDHDCRFDPPQIVYEVINGQNEPHTKFPGVEPDL